MNEKIIEFGDAAREKLLAGVTKLYDAVSCTLGPMGKNVIIKRSTIAPAHITKDGVTVVRDITMKDPIEDIGAQVVKEAALKTADTAGDGTTTATVLASQIITKGIMQAKSGVNTVKMKNGIEAAAKIAVEFIKNRSVAVNANNDEIRNIATISANNDAEIGDLIAKGIASVKEEGTIAVETSKTGETTIEVVEGMKLDKGYVSPYFMTDVEKLTAVLDDTFIMCCDTTLSSMAEIMPILETVAKANASIVIFAHSVEGEALSTMILNKVKGQLKVAAVNVPSYHAEIRKEMLKDIAIVCGGNVLDPSTGMQINGIILGKASKVVITRDNTTIIGGAGNPDEIKARQAQIRSLIDACKFEHESMIHKNRLAKLSGGVAILHVGAATEIEMKEKKDRIDDALAATKAALEEGIIPGGGVLYLQAATHIESLLRVALTDSGTKLDDDHVIGMKIMTYALRVPFDVIMTNAGKSPEVIYNNINTSKDKIDYNYGYDAKNDRYGDMLEMGIIDPAKVARIAIETASSIACTFLTTACVIAPEKVELNFPLPGNAR